MNSFYDWFNSNLINSDGTTSRRFQLVVQASWSETDLYTDILCREPNVYFSVKQLLDIYQQEYLAASTNTNDGTYLPIQLLRQIDGRL